MKIATGSNIKATHWFNHELDWERFADLFERPRVYASKAERNLKCPLYIGGNLITSGGQRIDSNMGDRWLVTLDYDDLSFHDASKLWIKVKRLPFEALIHTSFSHTDKAPKLRVIIPLEKPVSKDEYKKVAAYWIAKFEAGVADKVSKLSNHPMFMACKLVDGQCHSLRSSRAQATPSFFNWERDGEILDAQEKHSVQIVQKAPIQHKKRKPGGLGSFRKSSNKLINQFNEKYTIEEVIDYFLTDFYTFERGRYKYKDSSSDAPGGCILKNSDGNEYFMTHSSTDPAHGKRHDAFGLLSLQLFENDYQKTLNFVRADLYSKGDTKCRH